MINGEYILVIAPDDYPGNRYRNRYCYEHHLEYWKYYGIIPKDDEVIHHKDGNKHNNDINNLELIKSIDHINLHNKSKLSSLVLLKCPGCRKLFVRQKRNTFLNNNNRMYSCCSRRCSGITSNLIRTNNNEYIKRISENVIKEFKDIKSKYDL